MPVPEPQTEQERKPAIRTMKSDVEELFKTAKPSLVQILGEELTAPTEIPKEKKVRVGFPLPRYLLVLTLVIIGGAAAYFFLAAPQSEPPRPKLVPSTPFFAAETSRTIEVNASDRPLFLRLLEDSLRESERQGTIKRVAVKLKDGPQERFMTVRDFLNLYRISPPSGFLDSLEPSLLLFVYHSRDGTRLGLAARAKDPDRTLRDLINWEAAMLRDFTPLFFEERPEVVIAPFEDRTYRNIDWRYIKLSQSEDLGIGYTVFPAGNVMVITTGKEQMETVINRLFDAR